MIEENFFEDDESGDLSAKDASLGRRAARGGIWVFVGKFSHRFLGIVRTIVLARLLSPDDFGLMGIAVLAINMLDTFSKTGFEAALIQKKEQVKAYLDTAWTVNLLRSFILFSILFFGAPLVAVFFKSPEALPVVRVLAFIELFMGAQNIGVIFFKKELSFDKSFLLEFSGLIANITVSLVLAFVLRNVWALVYGALAGAVMTCVMSYAMHAYRPSLRLEKSKAFELFHFGKWLFVSSILVFLITQGDSAFIGRMLGITALGFYQMAYRLSNAPATEITNVISQVTFPVYAKIQGDIPRLREAYLKVLKMSMLISLPMAAFIFVLAPDFTRLFLGNKWMPMVATMRILVLWGVIRSISATAGPFFYAIGRPHIPTKVQFWQFVTLVITIYPFTHALGMAGTALAVVTAAVIPGIVAIYMVIIEIKCGLFAFLKPVMLPFSGALLMSFVMALTASFFPGFGYIYFFAIAIIGMIFYAGCILLFEKYAGYGIRQFMRDYLSPAGSE
ncbi:MAG: lipopolysaccharide biosynthesis protein [Candidatus Tantalella remota]|nr:lipopolysaccharide biosynthesis protein [Candidatus Tantalella remota]